MHAWHQQRGHQAVQRTAYEKWWKKWWTAMYIRKWQRPKDDLSLGDRFLCETRIERDSPLSDVEEACSRRNWRVAEFGVKTFETLSGQYEPQPYQLVGPLEMAPSAAPVTYALITHWASNADLSRWQDSASYRAIEELRKVTTEIFVPFAEPGQRANLRHDKLQRDWTRET